MRVQAGWWVLAAAVFAALVVNGCSKKKSESEGPPAVHQAAPQAVPRAAAPTGEAQSGGTVTPADSVKEIWAQIADEQDKLSAAIQTGRLKNVHHLASGIRDLVVALADKASVQSPAVAPRLEGLVEQVKACTTELGELGDGGDLRATQMESAKLNAILDAVKATAPE